MRHTHERWDGAGYPDGLTGEAIPLGARIIAVVDAYEAMTSERPYRRGLSLDEALARLQAAAGTQFDPEVVEVFVELVFSHQDYFSKLLDDRSKALAPQRPIAPTSPNGTPAPGREPVRSGTIRVREA